MQKQCEAFLAVCSVLDLLQAIGRTEVTGRALDKAAEAALASVVEAGWSDNMINKFHWMLAAFWRLVGGTWLACSVLVHGEATQASY